MSKPDINVLLDDLMSSEELRREWEIDPSGVASRYALTTNQLRALLDADVEALISEGLAERHVQQMRVSW